MTTTKIATKAEVFYSAAWHEVPIYTRDVLRITRRQGAGTGKIGAPAQVMVSIKNDAVGTYSPRVATSPLYGLAGRNTPIRITIEGGVRFHGEVESWPQKWNVKGNDIWAPVTAYGMLRRINAPGRTAPSKSALTRAYTLGVLRPGLFAYWAMEEGPEATQAESFVDGVGPLIYTAAVEPAGVERTQVGSSAYPLVADGARMLVPDSFTLPTSSAGFLSMGFVIEGSLPRPTTAKAVEYNVIDVTFGTGSITRALVVAYCKWTGTAFDATNVGIDVILTGGTSFGSVIGGVGTFNVYDGNPHDVQIRMTQVGADVLGQLYIDGVLADDATSTTKTLGTAASFIGPLGSVGSLGGTTIDNIESTLGWGQLAFSDNSALPQLHDVATGHIGESAADRIERLLTEDGIPNTVDVGAAGSPAMGVQRIASTLSLLQDCVDVDGGMLYEPRDSLGVNFRATSDLYNQTAVVALDYRIGDQVAPPLEAIEDASAIENDVTVTRYQGGARRAVQETGPMNVQEPTASPQGVGRYERDYVLVVEDDDGAAQIASWKLHIGTTDQARFPRVVMDVSAMRSAGNTTLATAAAAYDVGDLLTIAHPPAWLPPETIEQLASSFVETIESHHWTIEANTLPALPYEVWSVEGGANRGRIPPAYGETTVNEALDATETGVDIISTTVRFIDSATFGSMFPFDVMINGERMTVTAITGTILTQTMTVTRSVNGVVKTHASGSIVELFKTPVIGQ